MDFITAVSSNLENVSILVTSELIEQVLPFIRRSGKANNKFDINLTEGKVSEQQLSTILANKKIEVKRDFRISETGNFAIEYMCRNVPSGISTSQAEWWALVPDGDKYNSEVIVLIKKNRLLRMLQNCRTVKGGDLDGGTKGVAETFLLPFHQVVQPLNGKS